MKLSRLFSALFFFVLPMVCAASALASAPQGQKDNDQTLRAMRDEMERSKTRLELKIPGTDQPVRPYYVEYRLLDLDFREISGEFGTLLNSNHSRSRFMNVEARVGNYKLDSSNFISEDGFRGFIGSTGSVGIDRDYDSLRQDLWIATDQAFKEAVETYSRKQAYLSSLARQSDINCSAGRKQCWPLRTSRITPSRPRPRRATQAPLTRSRSDFRSCANGPRPVARQSG